MNQYPQPGPPHQSPQSSGTSTAIIMVLIAIPAVIAIVGVFAVLSIFGVRKYIAGAKTAEAKNTLGQLGMDALAHFEDRGTQCASASSPVPRYVPHAVKYQSSAADWQADADTGAGFACLKFELSSPQYYQYDYQATAAGFTATARGDMDGDGKESLFQATGTVVSGKLTLAPTILETNPDE